MTTRRGLVIQRAALRRYFPGADGHANPRMWFVLDPNYDGHDGTALCIAGPFTTQRDAFAAAQRECDETWKGCERPELIDARAAIAKVQA